ncbi:hypothetical protein [Rubricoccus marinus]|nr:hypothetical protein [Rubricoccus marinus]
MSLHDLMGTGGLAETMRLVREQLAAASHPLTDLPDFSSLGSSLQRINASNRALAETFAEVGRIATVPMLSLSALDAAKALAAVQTAGRPEDVIGVSAGVGTALESAFAPLARQMQVASEAIRAANGELPFGGQFAQAISPLEWVNEANTRVLEAIETGETEAISAALKPDRESEPAHDGAVDLGVKGVRAEPAAKALFMEVYLGWLAFVVVAITAQYGTQAGVQALVASLSAMMLDQVRKSQEEQP